MNTNQFLTLFDRVADTPDAVIRLRRFVLDLAVRGKLVRQDPADEPADELLKRIDEEKARLAKVGAIRKPGATVLLDKDNFPFTIPDTWCWGYFGNIVDFSAGKTPPRKEASFWNTGDFPWISIADMRDGEIVFSTKETISVKARNNVFKREPEPPGTMIMSFKLTIGKIAKLGIPAFHNEAIISIRPHVGELSPYLFKVLPTLARGANAKNAIKGATLNRKSLSTIVIPLPPLAEQHRIVAKITELMTLCDQLETGITNSDRIRTELLESLFHDALTSVVHGDTAVS